MIPYICDTKHPTYPDTTCDGSIYFEGIEDVVIYQGADIDLAEGVSAYDANGNEIPFSYSPHELVVCEVGEHIVTYSATGTVAIGDITLCGDNELSGNELCDEGVVEVNRTITIIQANPPTITGTSDIIIEPGITVDMLYNVVAYDANGNEISVNFNNGSTETEIRFDDVGEYTYMYSAEDCCGNTNEVERTIYVQEDASYRFEGAEDTTVSQGSDFDPTDDVTAYDSNGNEVSYEVDPTEIDTCEVGEHVITYTVGDVTVTRTITITQNDAPTIYGADDTLTVEAGVEFDPLDDVRAVDANLQNITVTATLDEEGDYLATENGVYITDENGEYLMAYSG